MMKMRLRGTLAGWGWAGDVVHLGEYWASKLRLQGPSQAFHKNYTK